MEPSQTKDNDDDDEVVDEIGPVGACGEIREEPVREVEVFLKDGEEREDCRETEEELKEAVTDHADRGRPESLIQERGKDHEGTDAHERPRPQPRVIPGRREPLAPIGEDTKEEVAHERGKLRSWNVEDGDFHPAAFINKQEAEVAKNTRGETEQDPEVRESPRGLAYVDWSQDTPVASW